jgi:hypothetical protein
VERAGIPAAGIICTGFVPAARMTAEMMGLPTMRVIEYPPPNIAIQKPNEIQERSQVLVDKVIRALTEAAPMPREAAVKADEGKDSTIVLRGTLEEVNDFFYRNQWTDGLPIIPPTLAAVAEMLKYTERSSDEVLGVLPPANRQATVWAVAVNGVMAGCRPEYMPVLLSVVEAIAEPRFGLQHAGSTIGWTPLIILNGPIIKELNFNSGLGVLRPQRKSNITVARFLRLAMVNIAGYLLGVTDMATFGLNYIPVLAEAEDESPYEPLSVDRGFKRGSNVVTVLSAVSIGCQYSCGGTAEEQLHYMAGEARRVLGGGFIYPMTAFGPEVSPLLCLSPTVASRIAEGGYSKDDIRQYIYENAKIPAYEFEEELYVRRPGLTVRQAIEQGRLPRSFGVTEDPGRMLPIMHHPDQLLIIVSGDPNRNRNFIVNQGADQGLAVSKEIILPPNWERFSKKLKK